MEYKDKIY